MPKVTPITRNTDADLGGQDLIDKLDTADYEQVIRIARRTSNAKDHSTTIQFRAPRIYARFTEIFKEKSKCKIEAFSDAQRSIYILGIKTAKKHIETNGKIGDGIDEMLTVNERLDDMFNRQLAFKEYNDILKRLKDHMRPFIKNKARWDREVNAFISEIEKISDDMLKQDLLKRFGIRIEQVRAELQFDKEEE